MTEPRSFKFFGLTIDPVPELRCFKVFGLTIDPVESVLHFVLLFLVVVPAIRASAKPDFTPRRAMEWIGVVATAHGLVRGVIPTKKIYETLIVKNDKSDDEQ